MLGHVAVSQIDAQFATKNQIQMAVGGTGFQQVVAALQLQAMAAFEQMLDAFQADAGEQIGAFEMRAVFAIDHGGKGFP